MVSVMEKGVADWEEVLRSEAGVDWDCDDSDSDSAWASRMKALSGQRTDWEPLFLFWRRLILLVASRLRISLIPASRVKTLWFQRRGLSPLSIPRVLHEMHRAGDILILNHDLPDPLTTATATGRLSALLSSFARTFLSGPFPTPSLLDDQPDHILVFKPVLQQKINAVVETLREGHWTSTCVLTLTKFQAFFRNQTEASAALSFLSQQVNARYLSVSFKRRATDTDHVQGVKISLGVAPVGDVCSLDYDLLKLVWTEEKLQKHINIIDQNWESSRKRALDYFKSGNREAALRHIRRSKMLSESRHKSSLMLERLEHLLSLLVDAESTYKVSEAIKIGTKAIKEQSISIEEVHQHIEELDHAVSAFNDVQAVLESAPVLSGDIEDEDIEEELGKLEAELLKGGQPKTELQEKPGSQVNPQELPDSLCHDMSTLNLEPA